MPNRDKDRGFLGGWFWSAGEDHILYRPQDLVERYYSSVGRNCNHLIGMVIDNKALVPEADVKQFAEYGRLVRKQYENCRGKIAGKLGERELFIDVDGAAPVNMFSVMEEISKGEKTTCFQISGYDGEQYIPLVVDKIIGHKRLIRLPAAAYPRYRLKIHSSIGDPHIREFTAYSLT